LEFVVFIGLTGTICSGHDTIGKVFQEKGFTRVSLSDVLREIMKEREIEINIVATAHNLKKIWRGLKEKERISEDNEKFGDRSLNLEIFVEFYFDYGTASLVIRSDD
jgi:dephospho-CoA kinase